MNDENDAFEPVNDEVVEDASSEPVTEEQVDNGVELARELITELRGNPSIALELVQSLSKITKPWEPISTVNSAVNEMTVPEGSNPSDFRSTLSTHISGFRLTTIFGDEVASIIKQTPKWKVIVLGQPQQGVPFVSHSKKAESDTKGFVEEMLVKLGYIIG